jgi:glucose/arabinose dehydrogenase
MLRRSFFATGAVVLVVTAAFASPAVAVPAFDFATPVFGLAARGDKLLAADAGAGIVRLGADTGKLVVELPGVTDVAPLKNGRMWALTSAPKDRKLYRVNDRQPRAVANIGKFERTVNPDEGIVESNPFDLAKLPDGEVLVADAAANALLIADREGDVDWVATLPDEVVSTANAKTLVGCPDADPEFAEICELPAEMPAQPVTTSVAVGPDGAYYLTELKGFPAPLGESRVWRIEPGTLHAHCEVDAPDSPCSVVADGFTSIVDINFAPDGTAFVVELDEASWAAVEIVPDKAVGGTVNECNSTTWTCTQNATGLTMPMAVAVNDSGSAFAVVSALVPGDAEVIELS